MTDPNKNVPDSWEDRLLAETFDFQLKFYVGGQRPDVPEDSIWALDWNDDHSGITDFDVSSTLSVILGMDETDTLTLADSSSFLPATTENPRTVFVKPYTYSNSWERIVYTGIDGNDLTGLTRRNRTVWPYSAFEHPVGTTVYQWVPVTDIIIPDFDFTWTRNGNIYTWSIPLRGIRYNKEVFDGRNMVVCQVRFDIMDGNGFTDWVNWWAGYIVDAAPTKDYEQVGMFAMNVASLHHLASLFELPAHHVGKHNIAAGKSVTTSSVLLNPALERSGEYFGTPAVDGSRVVDEDVNTPWVSEGAPSSDDVTPGFPQDNPGATQNRHLMITEVYFQPDGYGDESIWVEIHNQRTDEAVNVQGLFLANKQTVWNLDYTRDIYANGAYGQITPGYWDQNGIWHDEVTGYLIAIGTELWPLPSDYVIPLPDVDIPALGYLVMCKSMNGFITNWTVLGNNDVYDWRLIAQGQKIGHGYETHADDITFDKNGDWLQLWSQYQIGQVIDEVFWDNGDGNVDITTAYPDNIYYDPPTNSVKMKGFRHNGTDDNKWTGAVIDVSDGVGGKSIRRISDVQAGTCAATQWEIDDFPSPGAHRTFTYGEYASVDLGTIPTVLERDLLTTDTVAYVSGGTLGFSPNGQIMLGIETVPYSSKTGSSFEGLSDIDRQDTYSAGTPVYPIITDPDQGQIVSYHYPVRTFGWRRPVNKPYPRDYMFLASTEASPRYPEELDVEETTELNNWNREAPWWDDWDEILATGMWGSNEIVPEFFMTFSDAPQYYRHWLMGIFRMSDDGRAKVGEIEAWLDDIDHTDGEGNTHNFEGPTVHDVTKHFFVEHFGLSSDKVTVPTAEQEFFYIFRNLDTQKSGLLGVMDDLCDKTGTVLVFQPAFGVRIKKNVQFPVREAEPVLLYTFSEPDIESGWPVSIKDKNKVKQVELYARNADNSETFYVRWPVEPNVYGVPIIMRNVILGSVADAEFYARKRFKMENFMNEIVFRVKGIGEWITPTSKIAIDWDEDEQENPLFQAARYFVTGVTWQVRASDPLNKTWACQVSAEQDVSW